MKTLCAVGSNDPLASFPPPTTNVSRIMAGSEGNGDANAASVAVVIVVVGTERWKVSLSVADRICEASPLRFPARAAIMYLPWNI